MKEEVIAMWQKGVEPKEISKLFNISRSSISRWTNGVELYGKRKELFEIKQRAINLRSEGKSAKEISEILNVPKGTIGHWVAGVKLTAEQRDVLKSIRLKKSKEGCQKGSKNNVQNARARWSRWFLEGKLLAATEDKAGIEFRIICALYWGEGGKTRRSFVFTNSDPDMLRLVTRWITAQDYDYTFQLRYHSDRNPEELMKFWFNYLEGLGVDNVFKSQQKLSKSVRRTMPYGCVQIGVWSAELYCKVMGGISYLKNPTQESSDEILFAKNLQLY